MSRPLADPVFDIGRDLQRAYEEGYKQGRYDEMVETEMSLPGWIPVSERLPSAEDCPMDCMVTRRSKYVGNYTDMAVAEADGTWTHEDWKAITIKGEATCISTRDADIIAWMPLPTPYKGGDDE